MRSFRLGNVTREVVHHPLFAQLPFTTLRFRVLERALLAGLREGASVKFRAERIAGENTLVGIRGVPPCVRFQPCD